MKDRLKFRVRDKHYNQMCDVVLIDYGRNIPVVEWHLNNGNKRSAFIGEVILMQCTGQKDKNGKLAYEGDIVKYWILGDSEENSKVADIGQNDGFSIFVDDECFEIIGNIYENPELMGGNND